MAAGRECKGTEWLRGKGTPRASRGAQGASQMCVCESSPEARPPPGRLSLRSVRRCPLGVPGPHSLSGPPSPFPRAPPLAAADPPH